MAAASTTGTVSASGSTSSTNAANPSNAAPASESDNSNIMDWQGSQPNMKGRVAYLFMNDIFSDILFIVGKGSAKQRIPAHRFLLAMSSTVFDAMFNGPLSNKEKEIELPDVEPDILIQFLKFLYTDDCQLTTDNAAPLLYTARKYAVRNLENACTEFLEKNVSPSNAIFFLHQGRLFEKQTLIKLCLEIIVRRTAKALAGNGFEDVDVDTLCCVLEMSDIFIPEVKLLQFALRWALAQIKRQDLPKTSENYRKVLGRALGLIRFPLMSVKEFVAVAYTTGLLTNEETMKLFNDLFASRKPDSSANFLSEPRGTEPMAVFVKRPFAETFQVATPKTVAGVQYNTTGDTLTRFSSYYDASIKGFEIFGSTKRGEKCKASVRLVRCCPNEEIGRCTSTFISDGTNRTYPVVFTEPVNIAENVEYNVEITLNEGFQNYYLGTNATSYPSVKVSAYGLSLEEMTFSPSTQLPETGNSRTFGSSSVVVKQGQILSTVITYKNLS